MEMRNAAQWLFLLTGLTLAYLVLPPFFFILHTSLVVDRGLQAGAFTFQHFENIVESLGDVPHTAREFGHLLRRQRGHRLGLWDDARLAVGA